MKDISSGGVAGGVAAEQALAAELLGAIGAIRKVARRVVRSAWRDQPLTQAQSELLRLAAAMPGIGVADAAHELWLAPNSVSTLVGRLVAEGLLERARTAPDARSVRLLPTAKGTRWINERRDLRAELTARALRRLSAADADALAAAVPALLRLAANINELDGDGGAMRPGHADAATAGDPRRAIGDSR